MRDMTDLIAQVLDEHRTDGAYVRRDDADMWSWWCQCGARAVRPPGQGMLDVQRHIAEAILDALEDSQPDHIINLIGDGLSDVSWVIQHSMACRLAGNLFDCPYNRAAVAESSGWPWPGPGRYQCTLGERGNLVIGEAISRG